MLNGKKELTPLELVNQITELTRAGRSGSLIEYTRATRVEPIALIDRRAALLPDTEDVLNSLLNIFAGYYLQAVALSVNVGSVDVLKLLEKLNPNRDPLEAASNGRWSQMATSMESMALPFPNQPVGHDVYSQENATTQLSGQARMINENGNLSVGKLIEVGIESDGKKATFPVMIRMIANTIEPDTLSHILSLGSEDNSFKERYHKWRSGQINFIRDLIMCQDLIDKHKRALMSDKSGYYRSKMDNRRKNSLSAILSGNPSVATASSIFVLTTETIKDLERSLRGRIRDFKTREKLFAESYGMMMAVIDPDFEMVTIYHRSIEQETQVSLKELKRSNSRKGPDILDILKAFQQNTSPTF